MRTGVIVIVLALSSTSSMCGLTSLQATSSAANLELHSPSSMALNNQPAASTATAPARVDFTTQVKPIMEGRCQPCHFQGGTMYQKLPFDRPETIKTLGEKLFTRLKQESDRKVIREFLSQ